MALNQTNVGIRLTLNGAGAFKNDMRVVGAQVENFGRKTASMAATASKAFLAMGAAFAAVSAANKAISIADEWQSYASRLKEATNSAQEYEKVQQRMAAAARRTSTDINASRETFIQLAPVLRDMGYSLDESMDAIETFSGLLITNAASAEKGKTAMEALAKSLQKGKVDVEAWMSMYTTVDSVVELIAETSGKSSEEIRKLGAAGKLSIRDLTNALTSGLDQTMEKVARMPTTVSGAVQNFKNSFNEMIGSANEASGATGSIATAINSVADQLNSPELRDAAQTIGDAIASVIKNVAQTVAFLAENFSTISTVIKTLAAVFAGRLVSSVLLAVYTQTKLTASFIASSLAAARAAGGFSVVSVAAASASIAVKGLQIALSAVGGLVGLVTTAALLLAGHFSSVKQEAEKVAQGITDLQRPVNELIDEYKELSEVAKKVKLDEAIKLSQEAAKEAKEEFRQLSYQVRLLAKSNANLTHEKYAELTKELTRLEKTGREAVNVLRIIESLPGISPKGIKSIRRTALNYEEAQKRADGATASVDALKKAAEQAHTSTKASSAKTADLVTSIGQQTIADLEKSIALLEKRGTLTSKLYDIEQGKKGKGPYAEVAAQEIQKIEALERQRIALEAHNKKASSSSRSSSKKGESDIDKENARRQADAVKYLDNLRDQVNEVSKLNNYHKVINDVFRGTVTLSDDGLQLAKQYARALDERVDKEKLAQTLLNKQNAELQAQQQLMTEKAGYQSTLDAMSMGDVAAQEIQYRQELEEKFNNRRRDIEDQRRSALVSAREDERAEVNRLYSDLLAIEEDYQSKSLAAYEKSVEDKRTSDAVWQNGASRAWENYKESAQNAANQAQNAMGSWLKAAEDGLVNFVMTGKMNFKEFANSIIADLVRIAAQKAVVGIVGSIFGGAVGASASAASTNSFAQGGYTGAGSKYQPAGIVHAGEYVINAQSTRRLGLGFLERLNNLKGYAAGGFVGPSQSGALANSGHVTVNIHNAPPNTKAQSRVDTGGTTIIDVIVGQIEQSIAYGVSTGTGPINRAFKTRYGLQER